jgi:hypothetical protein
MSTSKQKRVASARPRLPLPWQSSLIPHQMAGPLRQEEWPIRLPDSERSGRINPYM